MFNLVFSMVLRLPRGHKASRLTQEGLLIFDFYRQRFKHRVSQYYENRRTE